jgi:opacity protein-like surface antigen
MKKSLILLSVIFVLVFNLAAVAQDEEDYEHDVAEFVVYGGVDVPFGDILEWSGPSSDAIDDIAPTTATELGAKVGYNMGFDLGYFFAEPLVVGLGFRFSEYSIDSDENDTVADGLKHRLYNPNIFAKYYPMPTSDFSPYLKANVGLTFLKFTTWVSNENGDRYRQLAYDPAFSYGIGGGLFLYTADYGGFFVEGNYNYVASNTAETEYEGNLYTFDENLSSWEIRGGIRILIGSGE